MQGGDTPSPEFILSKHSKQRRPCTFPRNGLVGLQHSGSSNTGLCFTPSWVVLLLWRLMTDSLNSSICQGFLTSRNLKYGLPTVHDTDSCTSKVLGETDSLSHEEKGKQMLTNEASYSISCRGWPCTRALTWRLTVHVLYPTVESFFRVEKCWWSQKFIRFLFSF